MEKLDRLVWAEGLSVRAYGVQLGLRASEPGVLGPLLERLPPEWRPASSPLVDRLYSYVAGGPAPGSRVRRFHLLYIDHARVARDHSIDPCLDALEVDARHTVAALSKQRVFVHAGVVGWDGGAIVIPGASFSGKTSLVAELVRRGATYYSDEYAPIDPRGHVHPFAKPLSIRGDGERSAAELGGAAGRRPLPVRAILEAPYREGAHWRPRERSAGQGALALLSNALPGRSDPARTMSAVRAAASGALVLSGARGEAADMAERLLARVAA
ncbi:MAG: hypothetical protein QOE60_718 [Thermoleophilaceae bacterium]|nr:hypothetical protein [Thermoleophilaceae bacterium]